MKFVESYKNSLISKHAIILCVMVLSFLTMASTPWAATYYVDNNNSGASDFNPGTQSSPWKTIQRGAAVAVAGDTVLVKSGVYSERVVVKHSGASGKRLIFKAYPGDRPIIDGSSLKLSTWTGLFEANDKPYITVDGFEIRNSNECLILIQRCNNVEVKNCIVHDNVAPSRRCGIFVIHSDNGFVSGNEVYSTAWNGINILSCTNTSIYKNYVHDCTEHNGINVFPETDEVQSQYDGNDIKSNILTRNHGGIYSRYQRNNEISNNLVYENSDYGIYLENDQKDPHNFAAHSLVCNNTIVKNGGCALLNGNATYLTIKNNIFYNSDVYAIYMRSGLTTGHEINNNLYYPSSRFGWDGKSFGSLASWQDASKQDSASVNANPFFADEAPGDFRLTAESKSAIDKGADLSSLGISEDINENPRLQGNSFDIGAYEFNSGTNSNPLPKDDSATTKEDSQVTINVLANDSDPNGDTLAIVGVSTPENGTASIVGSSVRYVPNQNFFGSDAFTYTVENGKKETASARIVVSVTGVLDPPENLRIQ